MAQIRKDWIINGVLLGGIIFLVILITLQKMKGDAELKAEVPAGIATAAETGTSVTVTAANVTPTALPILETESEYNLQAIPSPSGSRKIAAEYPNLGKLNIFRALITPLPKTPEPTPTAAPTPSLEKAVENWKLWNPRRRPGKPTTWVFKDEKRDNAKIELTVGVPFTVNDGTAGDFEITAEDVNRSSVILKYKDQQKTFSLR